MRYVIMQSGRLPTFQREMLPPYSGWKNTLCEKAKSQYSACSLHVVRSPKMSVNFRQTTSCHITEDCTPHSHHDEDLKFHMPVMESMLIFCIFTKKHFNWKQSRGITFRIRVQDPLPCNMHCSATVNRWFHMVLLGMYNGYEQVMAFLQHTASKHSYSCEKYDSHVQHCVHQDNNNISNLKQFISNLQ